MIYLNRRSLPAPKGHELRGEDMKPVVNRFLKYASIDTQGNESVLTCPSNENQRFLAELLKDELEEMGISDVEIDENSFLYARIPANAEKEVPALAFFAHMDTCPDVPGGNIRYQIIQGYDGKDILLNRGLDIRLNSMECPVLRKYIGDDLLVTDGTTVLGAEGKAGVAEIMEAAKWLCEHGEVKHGEIYLVFTPDEELGYSTEYINMKKIPAKFGYTVDEGERGELNYENFNAATAAVTVKGNSIHPGNAKATMKNAVMMANEFINLLPKNETPATTEGYEGYYHISDMTGSMDSCHMTCWIRDFEKSGYEYRKMRLKETAEFLNGYYGAGSFKVEIEDYYFNMREKVEEFPEIIEAAREAMRRAGVETREKPIRGGTDGVTISFMGIPCPNIFSGCQNGQSVKEFISVQTMEKAVEVILNIIRIFAEK